MCILKSAVCITTIYIIIWLNLEVLHACLYRLYLSIGNIPPCNSMLIIGFNMVLCCVHSISGGVCVSRCMHNCVYIHTGSRCTNYRSMVFSLIKYRHWQGWRMLSGSQLEKRTFIDQLSLYHRTISSVACRIWLQLHACKGYPGNLSQFVTTVTQVKFKRRRPFGRVTVLGDFSRQYIHVL